ncbi:MAG: alpha/beta hydrolase, partial [Marinobacter sp.]|nr:alpha/beta hydrolase [Marinobacter sp.]
EGQGEPLVLIHGYPTASWDWSRIWPLLVRHYRVLALDMLGFGFSDKPPRHKYSIEDQADLHQGWLEQLGVQRVHLLVHDYGCSVAQELMAREQEGELPFSIASVCFLNGALFPEVHRPLLIQKLLSGPMGGLVSRGLSRRAFDTQFRRLFGGFRWPSAAELDEFWQLLTYNNGRGVLHRLIRFMEERRCHRNRWVGALQKAEQPMRVVYGQVDPISGVAMAQRFDELIPEADVVCLRRVGHYPHYEAPESVFEAFQAFQSGAAR